MGSVAPPAPPNNDPSKPRCGICWKQFASKNGLYIHRRVHTKERPYTCNLCGKTFTQKSSLNTHMILHSGVKNFGCMFCGKRFALKMYKTTHEKTCKMRGMPMVKVEVPVEPHPSLPPAPTNQAHHVKQFQIEGLDVVSADPRNTLFSRFGEENVAGPPGKPFRCRLCGNTYSQKGTLKTHLLLHSGLKNFHCDWCGKRFALKLYKKTHEERCKRKGENPGTTFATLLPRTVPSATDTFMIDIAQLISS